MRRAGFTLIEAMITSAVIGISVTALLSAGVTARRRATEQLEQQRATQVLEFEAGALSTGVTPNRETELALLAQLPNAKLEQVRAGRTVTVRLAWGRSVRELTVFAQGAR